MASLTKDINEVELLLSYLEFMSAITPNFDYWDIIEMNNQTKFFLRNGSKYEITQRLPEIKALLTKQTKALSKDFPPKKSIEQIVFAYNKLKSEEDIINTGITCGFLDLLMHLDKFRWYADMPYHFRIAIGPNKGAGGIEEEFLLKDAFILYRKAELNYNLLLEHNIKFKSKKTEMDKVMYQQVTDIKYEIANYSRLSVLIFFSFVECFVNSIGFSYLYRNENRLNEIEILSLKGLKKNGAYMNLKNRIESLQTIIRKDKTIVLNLTDEKQRKEPFISFFNDFENLRNASVHYSPIKQRIWMGPQEWIEKAQRFCDVALQVGIEIWKSCYPDSEGPLYMGKLEKAKQLELCEKRLNAVKLASSFIES